MIGKLLALLSGLAALSRFAALAKWLPGVGPFAAVASAVFAFLAAVARMFFQGFTIIVSNPVTLVTVGVLCMASAAGGVKLGVEWTEHRVASRQAKLDAIKKDLKDVDEQAKQDVRTAEAARKLAENKARIEADKAAAAKADADAIARAAALGRLRATAGKPSPGSR